MINFKKYKICFAIFLVVRFSDGRIVGWNSPQINSTYGSGTFQKRVAENSIGNLGIRVQAHTNVEPFPFPVYSIIDKPVDLGFLIDPQLGDIKLTFGKLDFEIFRFFVLVIVADDGEKKGTATCTISLLDRNDNVPMFTSSHTLVNAQNGLDGGSFVTSVRAIDKDATAPYNTVTYTLHGEHRTEMKITDQGEIMVATNHHLDRDLVEVYTLIVIAIDGVSPFSTNKVLDLTRHSSSTTVEVCVGACPLPHEYTTSTTFTCTSSSPPHQPLTVFLLAMLLVVLLMTSLS